MPSSDFPEESNLLPYGTSTFTAGRVVVFAPHPDDEVLGCGGALADLLDRGARLDVVFVTDGAAGARDALERGRVAAVLARWLVDAAPDLVFAPSPVETHPDHRAVSVALVRVAARASGDAAALALEGAQVAFFELSQPFRPNFLFDATGVLERKERAMAAFASQAAVRDYAGFVRGLHAYRRMTLSADVASVEAYS